MLVSILYFYGDSISVSAEKTQKMHRPGFLSVISWALYDLGNTIFSTNIVSLYFALWVVRVMGGSDAQFGIADSISMLLVFLAAPILGALSDQVHRKMPFLIITALLCVGFTALLGQGSLVVSLIIFGAANFMYQSSLIFYNALLPDVSTPENQGRVGGLGTGLGSVGSFLGVGIGILLLGSASEIAVTPENTQSISEKYIQVFQASALMFLIFSIPCFLWVRERARDKSPIPAHLFAKAFSQLKNTLSHARQYPGLLRFLVGRVFYIDAVNTVIVFLGLYATQEIGFTQKDFQGVFMLAIICAVIASFAWGWVVDRTGPKRALNAVLILWILVFAGTALIGFLKIDKDYFWPIACLAGISLGGTWSADRPYMLRLTPPAYVGEFFGLYTMAGRFASIIGPLLWALIADLLGLGRPAAVVSLLIMVIVGLVILQKVDDRQRYWGTEAA